MKWLLALKVEGRGCGEGNRESPWGIWHRTGVSRGRRKYLPGVPYGRQASCTWLALIGTESRAGIPGTGKTPPLKPALDEFWLVWGWEESLA